MFNGVEDEGSKSRFSYPLFWISDSGLFFPYADFKGDCRFHLWNCERFMAYWFIVIMAVWLYKIAVKTGKFDIIRGSIANISEDQRLQLLLIGFSFNAFLEGAAGFGVPIAISAALLSELGFRPLKAAALCLIANAASGAFGAIGIPVIVGAQMGDLTSLELVHLLGFYRLSHLLFHSY
jgi:L-lactate permease